MPVHLPKLDNRSHQDLVNDLVASIPKYSKEWTNFNPSDPGITVLELLAWVAECLMYRADSIPDASYLNFLKLVAGRKIYDSGDRAQNELHQYLTTVQEEFDKGLRLDRSRMKAEAQKFLNTSYRAVTADDFRALALEMVTDRRMRVEVRVPNNAVDVVVVPEKKSGDQPDAFAKIVADIQSLLDQRRLLGTRVRVRLADYLDVGLRVQIVCEPYAKSVNFGRTVEYASAAELPANAIPFSDVTGDAVTDSVEDAVARGIIEHLDPMSGGPDGRGWPYARSLMIYELFSVVDKIDAVRYVGLITSLAFEAPSGKLAPALSAGDLQTVSEEFEKYHQSLPNTATITTNGTEWKISDGTMDLYFIHRFGEGLRVYQPFTEIRVSGLINLTRLEITLEAM